MRAFTMTTSALLASVAGASTLQPPVLPLIVRNPYLSTWLPKARAEPWTDWPIFWTGQSVSFFDLYMARGDQPFLEASVALG